MRSTYGKIVEKAFASGSNKKVNISSTMMPRVLLSWVSGVLYQQGLSCTDGMWTHHCYYHHYQYNHMGLERPHMYTKSIDTHWHDDIIKWKPFPRYFPSCGKFAGHQWKSLTKASDAELWCFLWSAPDAGDLRRHRAQYDVTLMEQLLIFIFWHTKCFFYFYLCWDKTAYEYGSLHPVVLFY